MQLFISDKFETKDGKVVIKEKKIFDQLKKVLRAKRGYEFALQKPAVAQGEKVQIHRIFARLEKFDWDAVKAKILKEEVDVIKVQHNWVAVGILNKQSKMELVVQKLTELGVKNIIFFGASRSVVKQIGKSKLQRLWKITVEAAEQSWQDVLPNVMVVDDLQKVLELGWKKVFVANFGGERLKCKISWDGVLLIVWPEWGFDEKERKIFKKLIDEGGAKSVSLGDNVLRAETAAIVGWWLVVE